MDFIFQLRRDTARRWELANPVLADGEPGYEKDTGKLKIGDGSVPWEDLDYIEINGESSGIPDDGSLEEHINSSHPHPVYDDGPSLNLLYQNAKV